MTSLITADTALLSPPRTTAEQCIRFMQARPHGEYTPADIETIVGGYFELACRAGLDPLLCVAQLIHETGNLTSALSQRQDRDGRPLRNPAGIGVTGERSKTPRAGFVFDADRACYRRCCGFTVWIDEAIPAHIGRLLAYALKPGQGDDQQQLLIRRALSVRLLPQSYRGSAPVLRGLGMRWALSALYPSKLAQIANAIRSL